MIFSQPDFSVQPVQAPVRNESLFACFNKGKILMHDENGRLTLPTMAQLSSVLPASFSPFELAHTDSVSIFCPHPFDNFDLPETEKLRYKEVGVFRALPYDTAALITTSWHLWSWYQNNRFCGRCGCENQPDEKERALRCRSCGKLLFPIICPAIIVAITCGDRILLVRNARSTFTHYALVAGYVEVGETLEHAVHREVLEEVGIKLSSLRYIGNQPWGVSGSHMFAFHATADDDQPIHLQESELTEARWFRRDELKPREHMVSIAAELIERFRLGTL